MRLADDYEANNVASLERDPRSLLSLYRALTALRRQHEALSVGSYEALSTEDNLLAFVRSLANERLLIAANFGGEALIVPGAVFSRSGILLLQERIRCRNDLFYGDGLEACIRLIDMR